MLKFALTFILASTCHCMSYPSLEKGANALSAAGRFLGSHAPDVRSRLPAVKNIVPAVKHYMPDVSNYVPAMPAIPAMPAMPAVPALPFNKIVLRPVAKESCVGKEPKYSWTDYPESGKRYSSYYRKDVDFLFDKGTSPGFEFQCVGDDTTKATLALATECVFNGEPIIPGCYLAIKSGISRVRYAVCEKSVEFERHTDAMYLTDHIDEKDKANCEEAKKSFAMQRF